MTEPVSTTIGGFAALQAHIAGVHERGRIARQKIETALTYEEIEAVNF